jgi:hypothetical protein
MQYHSIEFAGEEGEAVGTENGAQIGDEEQPPLSKPTHSNKDILIQVTFLPKKFQEFGWGVKYCVDLQKVTPQFSMFSISC